MKRYIFIAIVSALVLALIIPTACAEKPGKEPGVTAEEPKFIVSDLVVTPAEPERTGKR